MLPAIVYALVINYTGFTEWLSIHFYFWSVTNLSLLCLKKINM